MHIVICVQDGMVQDVLSDTEGIECTILDYDNLNIGDEAALVTAGILDQDSENPDNLFGMVSDRFHYSLMW